MSRRVFRFGKDMMPRKEKPKSTFSKKPRLFRKMKMPKINFETLNMSREIDDQSSDRP